MSELSPVAQEVLAAVKLEVNNGCYSPRIAAAALRALADQAGSAKHWHVEQLRTIADELNSAT